VLLVFVVHSGAVTIAEDLRGRMPSYGFPQQIFQSWDQGNTAILLHLNSICRFRLNLIMIRESQKALGSVVLTRIEL